MSLINLNNFILNYIFKFLDSNDLVNISRSCTRFDESIKCCLQNGFKFRIDNISSFSALKMFVLKFGSAIVNIRFTMLGYGVWDYVSLWPYLNNIKQISIAGDDFNRFQFFEIINDIEKLEKLSVQGCIDEIDWNNFNSLVSLKLFYDDCNFRIEDIANYLEYNGKRLMKFSLLVSVCDCELIQSLIEVLATDASKLKCLSIWTVKCPLHK